MSIITHGSDECYVPDTEYFGGKTIGLARLGYYTNATVPRWLALGCSHTFDEHRDETADLWVTRVIGSLPLASRFYSVRSGSKVSMPGMMDTILNVNITDSTFPVLVGMVGESEATRMRVDLLSTLAKAHWPDEASSIDETCKHIEVYYHLESEHDRRKRTLDVLMELFETRMGKQPEAADQFRIATHAVWNSYNSDRAKTYRALNGIDEYIGTDVIVQEMVFGQLGCTGVAFSHDPNTGVAGVVGEVLTQAQGEELVAGKRTPQPIAEVLEADHRSKIAEIMSHLISTSPYTTIDMEFTSQNDDLYILQVREAKLTPVAKARIAIDGVISTHSAPSSLSMAQSVINALDINSQDDEVLDGSKLLTSSGIGVVHGTVTGYIATTHEQASEYHEAGKPFIFWAESTSPMDIVPMSQAVGIITASGGALSHAAIIATSWNTVAAVGCVHTHSMGPRHIGVDGHSSPVEKVTLEVISKDEVGIYG